MPNEASPSVLTLNDPAGAGSPLRREHNLKEMVPFLEQLVLEGHITPRGFKKLLVKLNDDDLRSYASYLTQNSLITYVYAEMHRRGLPGGFEF